MTVSELQRNINERVFSARNRHILTLRYIDGCTYAEIADTVYLSERQIRRICKQYEGKIYKGLKCP